MLYKQKDNLLPKAGRKQPVFFNPHGRAGITMPSPPGMPALSSDRDTQMKNKELKRRCRLTKSPSTNNKLKMQMLKITRFYTHALKNFPQLLSLQSP